MFDFEAWLNEEVKVAETNYTDALTMPRHQRLSFLVTLNHGFEVRGWGCFSTGPYGHRQGLEQEEALELIHYNGFISGISCCGVD
jgi:hypothetical protein